MALLNRLHLFAERMQAEGLPDIFIQTFSHYFSQLESGANGLIPEADIVPIQDVADSERLSPELALIGRQALAATVSIKLNGGLGTSMGLDKAKSLLPVKDSLTFLDIIVQQSQISGSPFILMNSFATDEDSMAALGCYAEPTNGLPRRFLQHKQLKIQQADLTPAVWPQDPALEWCPPGHGDLYTALITSGTLDALLAAGYRYAFISNSDNLGAVLDTTILGHFALNELPFMMEVADRTEADKKGGHLTRFANGRLLLRESAQCPAADTDAFQNVQRHRYFNTNNLWLNLPALKEVMMQRDYYLGLPMIRNSKTVDPKQPDSPPVYQLETAMGSAISIFAGAAAIRVPRSRFAPVKRTTDLLAVRSDAYELTPTAAIQLHPDRNNKPVMVQLDGRYYKFIADLDARFPHGVPSLIGCERFEVEGDVCFGANVRCCGQVHIINGSDRQIQIPDNTVLTGELTF